MKRLRRLRRWLIGLAVGLIVIILVSLVAARSLAGGPALPPLALPADTPAGSPNPASASLSGPWQVTAPSTAGYRVDQIIAGGRTTIVGRTDDVTGSLTIDGDTVTAASFTVELADAAANESQRQALDVTAHPTAELRLTRPIPIHPLPPVGATGEYRAAADLSFHGVTRPVDVTIRARRSDRAIDVLATVAVPYADWGVRVDQLGPLASLDSPATLEALLHLTPGGAGPP